MEERAEMKTDLESRPGEAAPVRLQPRGCVARGLFGFPAVFWLVLLVFLLTASGRVGNQDVDTTLAMTRAMLEGHLALPAGMAGTVPGKGGISTSQYGVGHSAYLMPYVGIARVMAAIVPKLPVVMWEEFFVSFSNVPVMGGLLLYLVRAWRRAGASEGRVGVGVVLFGLGSMMWPYAKVPFSDSLLALATFSAWFHWTQGVSRWDSLLGGVWLGLALVSRRQADSVVPILMVLAALDSWRRGNLGRLAWMVVGMLPSVLLRLWYNVARFGDPLLDQQKGLTAVGQVMRSTPVEKLSEVLFSSSSGYLPYNVVPVVVLALGLVGLWRHRRADAMVAVAMLSGGIGFLSLMRFGPGVSFGSRYLVYTIAFAALAWPFVPRPKSYWGWCAWGPVTVWSLWLMAGGAALDAVPVMYRVRECRPPFIQWKGMSAEWGRVLSMNGGADLPELESNPTWGHDAFRRPDFWWCHLAARFRKGGLVEPPKDHSRPVPDQTPR
jgi:hypothetical protein